MKALVIYSTLTGNTKKVAEGILAGLPEGSALADVKDSPSPEAYDLVVPGFWVDQGHADKAMLAYFENLKNKKAAFFFTLGAYPDSEHADEVAADTEKRLKENGNTVLGHFRCQGKVDPKLLERMKQMLPPDHPHAQMTPERKARLDEAAKHPDDQDLARAKDFGAGLIAGLN
ncbi:flavodoxin family protein [Deltaproteobacteria bacterium OttesenSCG-928-K17]|nr:flavodoxin family protein [Deltaproteobacteria bacterium OttesenSCG-928-K17]